MSLSVDNQGNVSSTMMFCGECSTTWDSSRSVAAPPPPTLDEMLFALKELRSNKDHICIDNPQEPNDDGVAHSSIPGRNGHAICNVKTRQLYPANVSNTITCRTRLRVRGICCSSEVPVVRAILKPLPGVHKLGINVATKVAFIDHDPTLISATVLVSALNAEKFTATILTDGGGSITEASSSLLTSQSTPLDELPMSRFVESTFRIPGLITDNKTISQQLRQNFLRGQVQAFHLHPPSRTLKVEHDPDLLTATRILNVLVHGLKDDSWGKIDIIHDGAAEGLTLPEMINESRDVIDETERQCCCGLKFTIILSGLFWILSLLSYIGGSLVDLKYAGIFSVLFGMPPVVMKAWVTAYRLQFDVNCMMVFAAFGALALGEFDEAASISFIFAISECLESRASGKARTALNEIISLRPEYANLVDQESGGIRIVPALNIPVGCIVSVRTGDKVPADGVVIEGTSSVDESSLTGEARMVEKSAGDKVLGGSINIGAQQMVVRTTSTVGDSTISRLVQLVEEAQANSSETEKIVDAFARKYTPVVLVVALLLCTVPWFFGVETGREWMLKGLIFIVIACPCALTISTPVTYSAGLAAAAKRGIIIKGGGKLEALGNVKTVLFDKTGTVTTGRFTLSHLDVVGDLKSRKEILELLAIMEGPSSHPLSACLVSAAKEEGFAPSDFSLSDHTTLKGEGVSAYVNEEIVYVGNERLFKRLGYTISPQCIVLEKQWSDDGGTVGFIGTERSIVGMFCVKDTTREEAYDVIQCLYRSGIEITMLTGDGDGAAQAVGKEIGLPSANIKSQMLPEDKLHYVSALKGPSTNSHPSLCGKMKLILFIGDGVNDSPALAIADVGVAMGDGASLAMEMSDVTLMDSNLSKLVFSIRLGAKVILTVKQNIAFTMLVNSLAVVATLLGHMTLLMAIVTDVGTMLLVTLNGMKLLSERTIDALEEESPKKHSPKRTHDHNILPSSSTDSDDGLELV
jgi:Cd2+/Zn2+-exporting ATPase